MFELARSLRAAWKYTKVGAHSRGARIVFLQLLARPISFSRASSLVRLFPFLVKSLASFLSSLLFLGRFMTISAALSNLPRLRSFVLRRLPRPGQTHTGSFFSYVADRLYSTSLAAPNPQIRGGASQIRLAPNETMMDLLNKTARWGGKTFVAVADPTTFQPPCASLRPHACAWAIYTHGESSGFLISPNWITSWRASAWARGLFLPLYSFVLPRRVTSVIIEWY